MKSYKTFTGEELAQWKAEVTKYMTEVHPKLAGVEKWEDMPSEFFNPGCELAKAIVVARDVANNPKQYKVKQAVKVIGNFLMAHQTQTPQSPKGGENTGVSSDCGHEKYLPLQGGGGSGVASDRGAHISEYLYMLPDDVKAMTEKLPDLYLQQTALASESDDLANQYERAEKAGDTALMEKLALMAEPINRELVQTNQDIRAIYEKVDECVEYYKKHGEVKPDDNDNDTAAPTITDGLPPMGKKPAECTKAEIDAIADPALQNKYAEIRIEANKKYLRRTDLAHTDEWREQVRMRAKELIDWDVKITDKIRTVMELAGVTDL